MNKLFRLLIVPNLLCVFAIAQSTETVLYNFGAYSTDAAFPQGGLISDADGNLYGVTAAGGQNCVSQGGCGTVYELSPSAGGTWTETILYNFCPSGNPCADGDAPEAGLVRDASGNFYGTTSGGGTGKWGTVFRLSPPAGGEGGWTETVLWNFAINVKNNGYNVGYGKLNIDAAGNLYGSTQEGGAANKGIVFRLSPAGNGTYNFSILRSFSGDDGADPQYGVAIDAAGNLYGTTEEGGITNENCGDGGACGLVYELSLINGVWAETVLYKFNGSAGSNPFSPISFDQNGNLYGTLSRGVGSPGCSPYCGGVFKLSPKQGGGGTKATFLFNGQDGEEPLSGVLVSGDALYGTTYGGPNAFSIKGDQETVLYQFCSLSECTDGNEPSMGTLIEHNGLLYGVTGTGGENSAGVIYSLTK